MTLDQSTDTNPVKMVTAAACITVTLVAWFFAIPGGPSRTSNAALARELAVLITGGGAGIGKTTALYLASRGWTVFVTVRKQTQFEAIESEGKVIPVMMDVTNDDHAGPAVERVRSVLKNRDLSLKAVVCNAGINPEGDVLAKAYMDGTQDKVEQVLADPAVSERVFSTNVIGVFRTIRAFLPLLRESESGGRILIIGSYFGSIAGALGLPHLAYEASKHALEGIADGMRRSFQVEQKQNQKNLIGVSLIKPGNIKTAMNPAAGETEPEVVAETIEDAIASAHPLPRYYPGTVQKFPTWLLCAVFAHAPTWLSDRLL
eukprot:CAMPEP_0195523182 /NCGR_PEP_ID=MMETSP0794_2-20130614/22073_1 /TAXON_ID=515487 /ORGANISM="Stephanopyxis turris, Strain CCMP 815" /LENGTH=316 /DNA_ID=CAMNT_0040653103 /DNA_START=20 /DNA_END=970 /DNA_ORIENTATION=+